MTEGPSGVVDSDDSKLTATALEPGSRWLCGLVGLVAGGAGAVAVFVTSNDVGSGVLLAIGTLFLVMATTGHPIISAKLGNNEIQLARAIKRRVQGMIEAAPPELQQDLAESVLETPLLDQDPLREYARGLAQSGAYQGALYELLVRAALERVGFELHATESHNDLFTDIVGTYKGTAVAVEVKWGAPTLRLIDMAARNADHLSRKSQPPSPLDGVLVVTSLGAKQERFIVERRGHVPVAVAGWARPEDDDNLRAGLEVLVNKEEDPELAD